ncbi:MAG: hypothetical protein ABI611_09625 [Solirubrobacteraceae bacterium]
MRLRLDSARAQDPQAGRLLGRVAQQRRLAHPGPAVHEQGGAAPLARCLDHAPEPSALVIPSDQQVVGV